jgi:hypothetical protein
MSRRASKPYSHLTESGNRQLPAMAVPEADCYMQNYALSNRKSRTCGADDAGIGGRGHLGIMVGSPPGVPGGGITGVRPPPTGGAAMPGSTPAGGQIMPFERAS